MKIVSSAILASVCAVALLLLVSLALDSGAEWPRIEVPMMQVIAGPQEVEPSAASVTISPEAAVARMKHCNIDAVIYQALQSGGGAGPICVID